MEVGGGVPDCYRCVVAREEVGAALLLPLLLLLLLLLLLPGCARTDCFVVAGCTPQQQST